jgi:AraC family transcriptional regulator, glycine betaine-responsive activator
MDAIMRGMDTTAQERPFRVGVLLIDGFALMSYASVVEPLRAANLLGRGALYAVANVAAAGSAARSSGGAIVPGDAAVGDEPAFDLLLVVAGGDPVAYEDAPVFAWLRRAARAGVTLGGVSGGPVILARAGLMAGRRMTVHWEHAPALAEIAPGLMVERSLYVIDRDRVTCAGGTAPMDLMHALIAGHHGAPFARLVSDWFMHTDIRPSGGPQRAGMVERWGTTNAAVLDAISAMESHLADPLELGDLARFAGVSVRQLNRLFRAKLGRSTMQFYRELRLETARNLLRQSPLPMTEIALATGFAGSAHFAAAHARAYGEPPSALRR